ncbi:MAG: radical SAM protein [Candidatus Omnitrophota bacterium]
MSLKICLIDPPVSTGCLVGNTRSMKSVVNVIPALGLAYLGAVLKKQGYEVRIIDCSIGISEKELINTLIKDKPDVVGLTGTTVAFESMKNCAEDIKKHLPDTTIIIGGAHLSAMPIETMQFPCFDIGVIGEGEVTLLELLKRVEDKRTSDLDDINGIVYRKNGQIIKTNPREHIKDLDTLPFPARHLLPPLSTYRPTPASYRKLPLGVLITTRGCPSKCTFCDRGVFGSTYRERSAGNVIDEMEELVYKFGAKELRFFDDTFTLNHKRVLELCAKIKERRLRVSWTCLTKVTNISLDMFKAMKEAGCWQVLFGLESGDDRMLKLLNKGNTVKQNEMAVRLAHNAGLSVRADFIVGTPGETLESLRRTLDFAIRVKVDYAHFNKFVPFPGTELYGMLKKDGYKFDFSQSSILDHSAIMFVPEALTKDEFKEFLDFANKKFYLRPSYILRRLASIRSLTELQGQIKGFFAIYNLA